MKRIYSKRKKSKPKKENENNVPQWAIMFLSDNCDYDSSSILDELRKLDRGHQVVLTKYATRVLADDRLRRNEKVRSGAVRLIVALLPRTFTIFKQLLSNCSVSFWYEVHFTAFSALDRGDLSKSAQQQVLALVEQYLVNAKSDAGFAAWKAGDILGDEWYALDTLEILTRVVRSARYVAGRNVALHGIQHAMTEVPPSEKERLLSLVRKVASEDPSAEVRDYATYTLTNGGCARHQS
jgi:hypothetical protein